MNEKKKKMYERLYNESTKENSRDRIKFSIEEKKRIRAAGRDRRWRFNKQELVRLLDSGIIGVVVDGAHFMSNDETRYRIKPFEKYGDEIVTSLDFNLERIKIESDGSIQKIKLRDVEKIQEEKALFEGMGQWNFDYLELVMEWSTGLLYVIVYREWDDENKAGWCYCLPVDEDGHVISNMCKYINEDNLVAATYGGEDEKMGV